MFFVIALKSTKKRLAEVYFVQRGVSTHVANPSLEGFRRGCITPRVVNFQLTLEQAHERFEKWHEERWLAPKNLLRQATSRIRPILVPFWLFEASAHVEYTGEIAFPLDNRNKQDTELVWRQADWQSISYREYPWTLPSMQIYGGYKYRRDFTDAAKAPGILSRTRLLRREEAERQRAYAAKGDRAPVELQPPTMRQAIAWELALRNIRHQETLQAEEALKKQSSAEAVRNVKVRVQPLDRRARLLYLPVFMADYDFGDVFNAHGERRPEHFKAVISGLSDGAVLCERHFCPRKTQLVAGASLGGIALAATGLAAPLLGMEPWGLLSLETAFWLGMVTFVSGIGARLAPQLLRQAHESQQVMREQADFASYVSVGLGPLDVGDDEQQVARNNAEWRRWEEADKWAWDEDKRRRWAESMWRGQHMRRIARQRLIQRLEAEAARQRMEAETEAKRQQRWGQSARQHRYEHPQFAGGTAGGGRSDFLGYYQALGLDAAGGEVTETEIKAAFRQAALQWHPDKQEGASEEEKSRALQHFRELRNAYEVLRDPARRKRYDSGEPVYS